MAGFDFTFTAGLVLNAAGLTNAIQNVSSQISKSPISISAAFPKMDTSQVSQIQAFVSGLGAAALELDKITVKEVTLTNSVGATATVYTKLTTVMSDGMGKTVPQVKLLTNNMDALVAAGYKVTAISDPTLNLAKSNQVLNAEINKNLTSFESMNKKAGDWYTRAEKMNSTEKAGIQSTTTALQTKIRAYTDALANNDLAGAKSLVPGILASNQAMEQQINVSKRAAMGVRSWADNIANAFKQTVSYGLSLGVVREAQMLLNEALKYTIDLNTEMVKIQVLQVEGAQSYTQITNLATSYNKLAQALGTTTLEVAKGSVEWLRQGRTIQETQTLLIASTQLAKLGALSEADATDYLTSTINSYQMSVAEAASVVDKLVAVDNQSATSAGEMATALRYAAASAADTGVSFDKLVSYIATISSVTRQNAEMVGQALKTMLTRMQDIKAGAIDSDGLGINNVEIALARVNIKLRDSDTTFRDFSSVLEDLAAKWSSLNDIEQANIAKSIAGVRQANMFRVLMGNMSDALKYQQIELTASGLATQRYGIYLDSVGAAQNRFTATLQGLFQSAKGFDKLIITVLNLASSFLKLVTSAGGLPIILTAITAAFIIIKSTEIADFLTTVILKFMLMGTTAGATATLTGTLTAALEALNLTNPIGWITLLAAAFVIFAKQFKTPAEQIDALNTKMQETAKSISDLGTKAQDVSSLGAEFEALKGKESLTADEAKRLTDIQNQLRNIMPDLVGHFDAYGNFIIDDAKAMERLTTATLSEIQAEKDRLQVEAGGNLAKNLTNLATLYKTAQDKTKPNTAIANPNNIFRITKSPLETLADNSALQESLTAMKSAFSQASIEAQNTFLETLKNTNTELYNEFKIFQDQLATSAGETAAAAKGAAMTAWGKGVLKSLKLPIDTFTFMGDLAKIKDGLAIITDSEKKMKDGTITEKDIAALKDLGLEVYQIGDQFHFTGASVIDYKAALKEATFGAAQLTTDQQSLADATMNAVAAQDAQVNALDAVNSGVDALNTAMKEQVDNGSLSTATVLQLISSHSIYADAIVYENGAFTINIAKLKDVIKAQIVEEETALRLAVAKYALATAEHVAAKGANEATAASLANTAAARGEILSIEATLKNLNAALTGTSWAGGSGSGGTSAADAAKKAAQDEYDARIKSAEADKTALKQKLDDYKKIIDARKALLKSMKDETDYQDTLRTKSHAVATIQNELLALSLDNSEEAKAKRLQLEDDLAKAKEDLDKTQTDRAYNLQIDALDKEYAAYEDMINGQMDLLDKFIQSLKDALQAILDQIDATKSTSSGGGGGGSSGGGGGKAGTGTGEPSLKVTETWGTWKAWPGHPGMEIRYSNIGNTQTRHMAMAQGGLITGGTAGMDSVPIMAMPGEGILNKRAVDAIGVSTLNKLNSGMFTSNNTSDMQFSMPIVVNGNLDKTVLPDIEKVVDKMFEKMNSTLHNRGYKRTTNVYST